MEPLVTNRRCLIWISVCPADESSNRWQKLAYVIFSLIILAMLLFGITASAVFCWKFVSIDLGRSVFSFVVVAAEFTAIYLALVGMILLRHKIGAVFDNL